MTEIRSLNICYKLLSRMDRRGQIAALAWLQSRLEADAKSEGAAKRRARRGGDLLVVRRSVGEAALSLLALLSATGGSAARRSVEVRGPINADVMVNVKRVAQ